MGVGYAEGLESIVVEFEKGDDEIKKVKKRFNLQAAFEDLEKRQKIFNDTKNTVEGMYNSIQNNYDVMTMTLPEDKKDFVKKQVKAIQEKLEMVQRFQDKVAKIEAFVFFLYGRSSYRNNVLQNGHNFEVACLREQIK